jgi:hypothetical protein
MITGVSQREVIYDQVDSMPWGIYRNEQWKPYVFTLPISAFARTDTNIEMIVKDLLYLAEQGATITLMVRNGSAYASLDLQYLDTVMGHDGAYTRDLAFRFLVLSPFWYKMRAQAFIAPYDNVYLGGGLIVYPLTRQPSSSVYSKIDISSGGVINAIAKKNYSAYVAGNFTTIGSSSTRVAKILEGVIYPFGSNAGNGSVLAIDPGFANDEIIIGGTFTTLGGTSGRLLWWNGVSWSSYSSFPSTVTEVRAIKTMTIDPSYYLWVGGSAAGTDQRLYMYNGSAWSVPSAGGINTSGSIVRAIEAYRGAACVGVQTSSTTGTVYAYNSSGASRSTLPISSPVPLGYPVKMRVYDDKLYVGWRASNTLDYSGIIVFDSLTTMREYIRIPSRLPLSDFDVDANGIYAVCDTSYANKLSAVWIYDWSRWRLLDLAPAYGNSYTGGVIASANGYLFIGTGLSQGLSNTGHIDTINNPGDIYAYPRIEISATTYNLVSIAIINHTTRDYLHVYGRLYGKTIIIDCENKRVYSNDDGNSFYDYLINGSTLGFKLAPGDNYVSVYGISANVMFDFLPRAVHYSRFII